MPTMDEHGEHWALLYQQWHEVNQEYMQAAAQERAAFMACAQGLGTGPKGELVDRVELLRRLADEKRVAMDTYLKSVFKR